jgi:hypothetical protein
MFFDMSDIERKDDHQTDRMKEGVATIPSAHEGARVIPGTSAQSLFSLPNTGIETASVETDGPFPLGDGRRTSCDSDKSLSSLATADIGTSAVERKVPCEFGSEHNLTCRFGRALSQSSNTDKEASSLELKVFSPRIKTLRTATEFVQQSIDLRHTGVERYSLEVNPPTVSGVFNSSLGVDYANDSYSSLAV